MILAGETSYMVKDPLAGEYVRLDEFSAELAQRMDGTRSADELIAWANERWAGVAFDRDYMDDLVRQLRQLKYLDDPFERSALVLQKARSERSRVSLSMFRNVTQINLGIFDPEDFLQRTHARVAFAFRPRFVQGALFLFLLSVAVLWGRRDHLTVGPGTFFLVPGASFALQLVLWIILLLTTVGHEFGHAYTVKRWGGQVNRMGFMLMWGLPCLFCDVSDSYLFADWKHKVYVALGGIYADILMAIGATALWWATPDGGFVNEVAARVMLFCGISGILINANPLVKLDGYYVLSEYLDMPELREEAFRYAGYLVRRHLLRIPLECPVVGRRRKRLLLVFVSFSFLYSASLLTIFYLFTRKVLIGWFGFLGALVALVALYYFFKKPIEHTGRTARLWYLTHRQAFERGRAAWAAVVALLLAVVLFVPFPSVVAQRVTLWPQRTGAVRAPEELFLREVRFRAGGPVRAGDTLGVLDAWYIRVSADSLARRAAAQRRQSWAATAAGASSRAADAGIREAGLASQAAVHRRRAQRAVLRAPFDGRVLSLSAWDRVGERMAPGETLCVVADLSGMRAMIELPEQDIVLLKPGAPARLRLVGDPAVVLRGQVSQVSWEPQSGAERRYRAWLALDGGREIRAGQSAMARVVVQPRTLASRFVRWLARWTRIDLWV